MKSRRRIACPLGSGLRRRWDYSRDLRPAEWGLTVILRGNNPQDPMSALGQKRTFVHVQVMSALPPKADIGTQSRDVRFVPKAECAQLFGFNRWSRYPQIGKITDF